MQLILTHINSQLPEYIYYNFHQLRIWNPDLTIYIICHSSLITDTDIEQCKKYNIKIEPYEELLNDYNVKRFLEISWYHVWGKPDTKYPSPPKFVQGTTERLYALEAYCRNNNLQDIFHIENDVMLYCNLEDILLKCKSLYSQLTLTPMADQDHTFAFTYLPSYIELSQFLEFNSKQLERGDQKIRAEFGMDMVHEMSLVKVYNDLYNKISFFPILPDGPYSTNFEVFNALFDPASWGQYIGGTNCNNQGIGYAGSHHIIGRELLQNKYNVEMYQKIPLINHKIKLNNLHIHSKQLERFLSL